MLLQGALVLIEINILLQDAAGAQEVLEDTLSDFRRPISHDLFSCYKVLRANFWVLCQYL